MTDSGHTGFESTRWSVILRAGEGWTPEARDAMATLCTLYWYPCYAFVRRKGEPADKAKDLTQGFFARLLEKNDLATVDPRRARFRTWLLSSLSNYLANQRDHEDAQKRNPGTPPIPIDTAEAEGLYLRAPSHQLTPEQLLDRRWATSVVDRARAALDAEEQGKDSWPLVQALKDKLLGEGDERSYQEIAERLGLTASAVKQAAYRLRIRLRQLVRAEVADTVELGAEDEIDDEIRQLMRSF